MENTNWITDLQLRQNRQVSVKPAYISRSYILTKATTAWPQPFLLPPMKDLSDHFGVRIPTVRSHLLALIKLGLIRMEHIRLNNRKRTLIWLSHPDDTIAWIIREHEQQSAKTKKK